MSSARYLLARWSHISTGTVRQTPLPHWLEESDRGSRGPFRGAWLIRDVLGRAEEASEPAVMVEGIPTYYPRFGFERASALGFTSPHPKIPDDAFMVKRLPGYSPELAGRIVYPAAFDALGYERPV